MCTSFLISFPEFGKVQNISFLGTNYQNEPEKNASGYPICSKASKINFNLVKIIDLELLNC